MRRIAGQQRRGSAMEYMDTVFQLGSRDADSLADFKLELVPSDGGNPFARSSGEVVVRGLIEIGDQSQFAEIEEHGRTQAIAHLEAALAYLKSGTISQLREKGEEVAQRLEQERIADLQRQIGANITLPDL